MAKLYDEICRTFATPMPRSRALKLIFGGLASAVLVPFGFGQLGCPPERVCSGVSNDDCCPPATKCCTTGNHPHCCAGAHQCCGNTCCPPEATCDVDRCVPSPRRPA